MTLILAPSNAQARQIHQFLTDDLDFAARLHNINLRLVARQANFDSLASSIREIGYHNVVITTTRAIQQSIGRETKSVISSLDLLVACDLHKLQAEYEFTLACLGRGTASPPRIVGFSAPLLDATGFADWLQVDHVHTFSFPASARPFPVITSFTYLNLPSSPGLLKAMIRPAYEAMRSNMGSTICFVPHKSQCYTTLADLLTASATDMNKLVEMDEELLAQYAMRISDPKIAEGIEHGFAIYNESMSPADQVLVRYLFNTHAIRALIAPRESCHSLEMTASLVIVMSTQYATYDRQTDERHIVDYPMDDLLRMQAIPAEHQEQDTSSTSVTGQCIILTQPDKASLITKLMNEGLPLESELLGSETLFHAILSRVVNGTIDSKQKCLDAIATTFMGERIQVNPFYYGREPVLLKNGKPESKNAILSALVDDILESLRSQLLIRFVNEESTIMKITPFGKAVSQNRITQKHIDAIFEMKESMALRTIKGSESVKKTASNVNLSEMQAFIKRLPRSIQRKLEVPEAKDNSKDKKVADIAAQDGPASAAEPEIDVAKALMLTFLNKKLPPDGSKLEAAQSRVAVALLEQLANASSGRK